MHLRHSGFNPTEIRKEFSYKMQYVTRIRDASRSSKENCEVLVNGYHGSACQKLLPREIPTAATYRHCRGMGWARRGVLHSTNPTRSDSLHPISALASAWTCRRHPPIRDLNHQLFITGYYIPKTEVSCCLRISCSSLHTISPEPISLRLSVNL